MEKLKLGSLFDGIGGFPFAAMQWEIEPVWASEIEPFPIKVTEHHFPDMKHLGDITQINGAEIEPVDIICGGFPCQDVSIAGKREGLDGERSGLFFEAIRVIHQMQEATNYEYPKVVVIENVPGLLSSNKGEDMRVVLDELQNLGFIVDPNILDAQYMGVPQRRRRVFIVCVSLINLLQMKTSLSKTISIECVVQTLLNTWSVIRAVYQAEHLLLDLGSATAKSVTFLQKKMNLLYKTLGNAPLRKLLMHSAEVQVPSGIGELNFSDAILGSLKQNQWLIQADMLLSPLNNQIDEVVNGLESIYRTLNLNWGENLTQEKLSTTLTLINEITTQQTYTFMEVHLIICEHIKGLMRLSNHYWKVASLSLTLLKECIDYARQTSSDLFGDLGRVYDWDGYIKRASDCAEQFERYFGGQCAGEILFKPEGLRGNITASRKAGKEVAGAVGSGAEGTDYLTGWDCQEKRIFSDRGIAPTLSGSDGGGGRTGAGFVAQCVTTGTGRRYDPETETLIPVMLSGDDKARTLTARADSSPCVDRGQDVVFVPQVAGFSYKASPSAGSIGFKEEQSPTILSERQDSAVILLYDITHADEVVRSVKKGVSPTLNRRMGTGGNQIPICIQNATRGKSQSGLGISQADVSYTLDTLGNHAVAFPDPANPLLGKANMSFRGDVDNIVRVGYRVRRLTPVECLRLQGFPDWWLDIKGMSDTQKYRAIGNSVAIPCVSFILERIAEVLRRAAA